MDNPWLELRQDGPPYVLDIDATEVSAITKRARYRENTPQTHLLPEPFQGDAENASVVCLSNNPGYSQARWEDEEHSRPEFKQMVFDTIQLRNPVLWGLKLNRRWMTRLLNEVLDFVPPERVEANLCLIDFYAYHSEKFHDDWWFPSMHFTFELVEAAMARGATIVVMRGQKNWDYYVPDLVGYKNRFDLNSPQNVAISRGNCPGFPNIIAALHRQRLQR